MKVIALFIVSVFLLVTGLQAQPVAPAKSPSNELKYQFNALKSRSSSYREYNQDYKVIQVKRLDAFWQNVQDSLKAREQNIRKAGRATEKALAEARQGLASQKAELQSLKEANAQKEQQIKQSAHDVNSLSVLGIDMNKQAYVVISWIIILGLLVVAAAFSYLYKKSKVTTD
jgi:Flp pilus assembly protein TadB